MKIRDLHNSQGFVALIKAFSAEEFVAGLACALDKRL